jgi:hypothetical protein
MARDGTGANQLAVSVCDAQASRLHLRRVSVMSHFLRILLVCQRLLPLSVVACGGSSSNGDETRCVYDEKTYTVGQTFPDQDGCNTCSCESDGRIACTLIGCDSCNDVTTRYDDAMAEAKSCDPERAGQCSKLVLEGLACACQTFVNAGKSQAIAAAATAQAQYQALSCSGGVACGPCLAPLSAYCSAAGRCEPVYDNGASAACKVNGVVYESGATGIPDPMSCNECECSDGQLICTEISCPNACPPGEVHGRQCAQCGPADECEVVEHRCLSVCKDTCDEGACVENVCKSLCG